MKGKRLLALLLAAALCLSLTAAAFASEEPAEAPAADGEAVEGVDYGAYTGYPDEYWFSTEDGLVALLASLEDRGGFFEVYLDRDESELYAPFAITRDLDIAPGISLDLYSAGEVTIQSGADVRLAGEMYVGDLRVDGSLTVEPTAYLVFAWMSGTQNVVFEESGSGVNADVLKAYYIESASDLTSALSDAATLPEGFGASLAMYGVWSITDSVVLPENVRCVIPGPPEGGASEITVAEGAVLSVNGQLSVIESTLKIQGVLRNTGSMTVYGDGFGKLVLDGGSYSPAENSCITVFAGPAQSISDILAGLDVSGYTVTGYNNYTDGSWEATYRCEDGEPADPGTEPGDEPGGPEIDPRVPTVYLAAYILSQKEIPDIEAVRTLRAVIGDPIPD